jgi:hypothetical protein
MRTIKRRWIVGGLTLVACVALTGYLATVWPWLTRGRLGPAPGELPPSVEDGPEPSSGRFVGHPEASIVERFGPSTARWQGHYGNPPMSYRRTYPDAVTVTYVRPMGTLYLSFCKEQGLLICFSSDWMPTGWVF